MQHFEKRLKFEKYKNMNNIITIDLHNDFTIIALIGRNENNDYDVDLRLKENTVDKWDLIEEAEHLVFDANEKIHSAILKTISEKLKDGFFDYYIERYKYELTCFDIGDDLNELNRIGVCS